MFTRWSFYQRSKAAGTYAKMGETEQKKIQAVKPKQNN